MYLSADGSAALVLPADRSSAFVRRGDAFESTVKLDRDTTGQRGAITPMGDVIAIPTSGTEIDVFDALTGRRLGGSTMPTPCGRFQYIERVLVSSSIVAAQVVSWACKGDYINMLVVTDFDGRHLGEPIELFDDNRAPVNVPMALTLQPSPTLIYNEPELDGVVRARDLATGQTSTLFDVGTNDKLAAIAVDPSAGQLAALAYESGRLELWNLETRTPLVELSRHDEWILDVAIASVEGRLGVTTVSATGAVARIIDDAQQLRSGLCEIAGRDLDTREWLTHVGSGDAQPCARGL